MSGGKFNFNNCLVQVRNLNQRKKPIKSMQTQSKFLKVAIQAAKIAEGVILKYYQKNLAVRFKEDNSALTIVDEEAEKAILGVLSENFPHHGFLGEELGNEGCKDSEYTWVVDPIDGTKNFSRGIPIFGTQIGLARQGKIIVGVANAPALGELCYAEEGQGAWCNRSRIHVSRVSSLDRAYLNFGGIKYFGRKHLVDKLAKLANQLFSCRSFGGDTWPYHLLAQGKIDLILDPDIKIWDVAGSKLIIEEAGGIITDFQGKPLDFNSTTSLAGNKRLHSLVLKYFRSSLVQVS